jgi:hypothetical protein
MPNAFEKLRAILFEGNTVAGDFKTAPGTGEFTRDETAQAIIESMERLGLVRGGVLIDPNAPKN